MLRGVCEGEEVDEDEHHLCGRAHPTGAVEGEDHRQDQQRDHVAQHQADESVDVPFEGGAIGGGDDQGQGARHQGRVAHKQVVHVLIREIGLRKRKAMAMKACALFDAKWLHRTSCEN